MPLGRSETKATFSPERGAPVIGGVSPETGLWVCPLTEDLSGVLLWEMSRDACHMVERVTRPAMESDKQGTTNKWYNSIQTTLRPKIPIFLHGYMYHCHGHAHMHVP